MPTCVLGSHQETHEDVTWRIIYRTDDDAIVIAEVFAKKTSTTPKKVIDACKRRFKKYDKDIQ